MNTSARERLRGSWAEWFRAEIVPILLEAEAGFSELYGERGRPNWSVARMLGICLLQHLEDLDDQSALDALSFDLRWQHALGLASEEAYLSRRSLVEFRRRLVARDPEGELTRAVFDRVCQAGLERLGLSTAHQRLDSTLIASNIRRRGRLSLARETIRVFLRALDESRYGQVSETIRSWYQDDAEGWENDARGPEAGKALAQIGDWARALLNQFAEDDAVRNTEPYELLARLVREHVSVLGQDADKDDDDEPPKAASGNARDRRKARRQQRAKKEEPGKARFWSPHDPDASCGHKGLGYHAHITETCRNDSTELVTDYDVVTAADNDVGRALPVIERLSERQRPAEVLYADGGYPTPAHLIRARESGTELHAPVHRGRVPADTFSRGDFTWHRGLIVACPAGHAPNRHGERASSSPLSSRPSLYVFFDAATCRACPDLRRCPVRQPNNARSNDYRLELSDELLARDRRWDEQRTDSWLADYRIRCGVEATMSELKRAHGLRRVRVRRLTRVRLQVAFKVTACNLKRWARALRRARLRALVAAFAAFLALLSAKTAPISSPAARFA